MHNSHGRATAVAQEADKLTPAMVAEAARIAGLSFSDDEFGKIAEGLSSESGLLSSYEAFRGEDIPNGLAPSLVFNPLPVGFRLPTERRPMKRSTVHIPALKTDEDLAFLPVTTWPG